MPAASRATGTPRKHSASAKPTHGTGHARIRKAAEDLLVERDGTLDILELAERAEVSNSLLYRYYPSKSALLAAVVDSFYDRYDAAVFRVPYDDSVKYATAIRSRLEQIVAFHYSEPLAATVLGRLARTPEIAVVDAERMAKHIDAAAAQVRHGQRIGALSKDIDPEVAGAVVIGGTHQALARTLARDPRPPAEWLTSELWRAISAALGLKEDCVDEA